MERERTVTLRDLGYGYCVTEACTGRDLDATCVKSSQLPALLLPVSRPFALQRWLVTMEFGIVCGCGDEGDGRDLLQMNTDFALAWPEPPHTSQT